MGTIAQVQTTFHDIGSSIDIVIMAVYFIFIMLFGSYFGKYNRSTKDFFFGGRRFTWWLIAFSIVATGVGSHSFIKYSAKGFQYGFSSTMTYINDWFFLPFFLFGWLPIIVYTKIQSIPEYFEKRFSPSARFLATILLLLYMIGYIGIGFLTLGKAIMPLLPKSITMIGFQFQPTLMGIIIIIAVITGIYITFGGQTAVIFTDLLQGFVLLFAGFLLFFLGIAYLHPHGGLWSLLPTSFKLPLADFNKPPDFNFVGIFWQDGVAGSVGFLFMNMGLIMRFMATKSVDEGRKAATFNILFMLPLSAIVVGNAGWIGKAISVVQPNIIPPNTSPDQIFDVVAHVVSSPGVFGFIMAALTAALMSTVDTLINATAAIYINDIHRPIKQFLKIKEKTQKATDKKELSAARYSSIIVTILGVVSVLAFKNFPTVYEAHGYFHSTLTPPLVVAIFLGIFWKRFTPAAVMATFLGGVSLMILGAKFPGIFIHPFAQGIQMNADHPYTYIRAFYNLVVCSAVGVAVTYADGWFRQIVSKIKSKENHKAIAYSLTVLAVVLFMMVALGIGSATVLFIYSLIVAFLVAVLSAYFIDYDPVLQTEGLTVWSIQKVKEAFKGGKINEREGEKVLVNWVLKECEDGVINFSKNDMEKMAADQGDLVYISDKRAWLGGLKSIHSVYGEPHDKDGVVYISEENLKDGAFIKGKFLKAEKEM